MHATKGDPRPHRERRACREADGHDIANVQADIARVQEQVNSIEAQLKLGRYEQRLGNLEDKVFGAPRR